MNDYRRITFIGGGNMAQALVGGLLRNGHAPERLRVADPQAEQREKFEQQGVSAFADNAEAARDADIIVLAVKPQIMDAVLRELAGAAREDALFISIAAGITLQRLGRSLGAGTPLVRAMPNTPALYGYGVTGMVANASVGAAGKASSETVLGAAGEVVWVESEDLMDAVTAVSGSGPAYYFLLTEALIEAAMQQELPECTARLLATRTAFGAGAMLAQSELDASDLRRRVTSPGGTTEAALEMFESANLRDIVRRAVDAAVRRGRELGL